MKPTIPTTAPRDVRSLCTVAALEDRLPACVGSEDYVLVIRALAATRDRSAIRVLASLLDSVGPSPRSPCRARVLRPGGGPGDAPVLAQLGEETSAQWLRDDDGERIEAYLDRHGFSDLAWDDGNDGTASEADEEDGVA